MEIPRYMNNPSLDELISSWDGHLYNGQEWEDCNLRDYLSYDYWSPHIALCTLSGFDHRKSENGDDSTPARFEFISVLSPIAFISLIDRNRAKEENQLTTMNADIDRLRGIWENSRSDIEGKKYPPAFFIKWAVSKQFIPAWLNWAIEKKLYVPMQEADQAPRSDFNKGSPNCPPEFASDPFKGAMSAKETKEQRQDRRLKACEDAGLVMPKSSSGRLPDRVSHVAKSEGVSRQAFSTEVKAALSRREARTKPGRVVRKT